MATAAQTIANVSRLAASTFVEEATFDSQITPGVRVNPFQPAQASPGGGISGWIGQKIMELVKPRATLQIRGGAAPIVYAPYGNPAANYGPAILAGGAAVVGLTLGAAFLAGRASASNRRSNPGRRGRR